MGARIKSGDEVILIGGKDRGKRGKVLRVERDKDRLYVEGLNMIKRHQRPQQVAGAQRPEQVGGRDREGGPDPHFERGGGRPEGRQADAYRSRSRGRQALPGGEAKRNEARLTMPSARLKQRYFEEIRPQLMERFGYSTPMQAPRISKVTVNMGVGDAKQDSKMLESAGEQLATITGQRPSVRRARKSIAQFKVREGMPVGVAVTLRGERSYEFLDRLMSVAIPRIRDFRGLNPRSFDGRGNYSLGVREQIIFPEVDYDEIDQVRGLDITITTTASSDEESFALLEALGMPFSREGRPQAAAATQT